MNKIKTTPKQLEIIKLIYRFRFLNRTHIQRFLNHKDPKRINTWLKDLTNKNITGRHYSNKLKENTKPAIYFLATKSKKILLEQKDINEKLLNRVYREKIRSQKLVEHCVLVAELYFLIKPSLAENEKLHFYTKTDLVDHYYLPQNRPDAYIAIESNIQTKRYFLEIIDEGVPRFIIRSKVNQYIEYFEENLWKQETGHSNPSVLIVCPNIHTQNFLNKCILQALDETEINVNFYLSNGSIVKDSEYISWEKVEVE